MFLPGLNSEILMYCSWLTMFTLHEVEFQGCLWQIGCFYFWRTVLVQQTSVNAMDEYYLSIHYKLFTISPFIRSPEMMNT